MKWCGIECGVAFIELTCDSLTWCHRLTWSSYQIQILFVASRMPISFLDDGFQKMCQKVQNCLLSCAAASKNEQSGKRGAGQGSF